MKCPVCGELDTKVLDTRISKDNLCVRRRRECLRCRSRFTTQETIVAPYPFVAKKDGRLEAFEKDKILKGIQAACQKRPVSMASMEDVVEIIVQKMLNLSEKEVSSQWIGQQVMSELRTLDDVAYVRFASVYKTFRDVQEFVTSLDSPNAPTLSSAELFSSLSASESSLRSPSPTESLTCDADK